MKENRLSRIERIKVKKGIILHDATWQIFEMLAQNRDCFCRSSVEDLWTGVKRTSDNNANRVRGGISWHVSSERLKIVCSTCNVRLYDVSRASWKFFPLPSLVGISFARDASGISRIDEDRHSSSSLPLAVPRSKYIHDDAIGSSKFDKLPKWYFHWSFMGSGVYKWMESIVVSSRLRTFHYFCTTHIYLIFLATFLNTDENSYQIQWTHLSISYSIKSSIVNTGKY